MGMKAKSFIFVFLFPLMFVDAQTSFVKQMDQVGGPGVFHLESLDSTAIVMLLQNNLLSNNYFYSCIYDLSLETFSSFRIGFSGSNFLLSYDLKTFGKKYMSLHAVNFMDDFFLNVFVHDMETGEYWMKNKLLQAQGAAFALDNENHILLCSVFGDTDPNVLSAFLLDEDGETLQKMGFSLPFGLNDPINVLDLVYDGSSAFYLLGVYESALDSDLGSFVLHFDTQGHVFHAIELPGYFFQEIERSPDASQLFLRGGDGFVPGQGGSLLDSTLVVCLDSALSLQWAKAYYADYFSYYESSLKLSPQGLPILSYSTYGAFPTILAFLDENGEIIEQTGYPFYSPKISIMADGSLALATSVSFTPSGGTVFQNILAKTDVEGHFEDCEDFPACMLWGELSVALSPLTIDTTGVGDLMSVEPEVLPWNFGFHDACEIPPAPSADFYFVDSLCVGACESATLTNNLYAHGVQWTLIGPGLELVLKDSLDFSYCFTTAGSYVLTQTVWFLGCAYSYSRQIEVLPDLENFFEEEVLSVCEEEEFPVLLEGHSSRPLQDWMWSTGSTDSVLAVNESGLYWLEGTDGYCSLRDTVELRFLDDLLTEGPPLILPADTVYCKQHLPYELLPQSPYTEDFFLPEISPNPSSSFSLQDEGSYVVSAEVFGCPLQDTFVLELSDCISRIYLPTAFSPNGDGLNDVFLPQGKDYRALSLQIYDRWGGVVYESLEPPFAWDGNDRHGRPALSGVYVYLFRYVNTLSGEEEMRNGELVLLR